MKILLILAHPNKDSLNYAMAKTIEKQKQSQGHEVQFVDLYHDEHRQDFLKADNLSKIPPNSNTTHFQELILWADNITFVFPYWWGSEPAILNNWIDNNLLTGFAFKYDDKGQPSGLLQGKTVTIYTTSGTPSFVYMFTGGYRWLKKRWKKGIVEFCGMKLDGFHTFGWVTNSKEKATKILQEVEKIA
ncbi:MAG: hypothetical protein DRG11_05170 [Epsilonproteobacteria bacterium]|nr:MAG: hypothetical protein DRG11_05170 [Campylobacterota bacterium]